MRSRGSIQFVKMLNIFENNRNSIDLHFPKPGGLQKYRILNVTQSPNLGDWNVIRSSTSREFEHAKVEIFALLLFLLLKCSSSVK